MKTSKLEVVSAPSQLFRDFEKLVAIPTGSAIPQVGNLIMLIH